VLARLLTDERLVSVVLRMAAVTDTCIEAVDSRGVPVTVSAPPPPRPPEGRCAVQVGPVHAGEVRVWSAGGPGRAREVAELVGSHLSAVLAGRQAAESGSPLAQAHERLALALDASPDALWDWDLETQDMDLSPRWFEMIGAAPGSLPGTYETWMSRVAPEDLKGLQAALNEAIESGATYRAEFRLRHEDGGLRWVLSRGRVSARDGAGQATRVSGINADITERKQQDEERRRLESALRQSEKLSAIGQLAGGIAHDFNNQLTAILGAAEVLGATARDKEDQELVADILTAGNRSAELTRKLLLFSRRANLPEAEVDLHQVLEEVAAVFRRSVDRRITLALELEATRHAVVGDASALSNGLLNLALNGRDAMPSGGTLTFRTRNLRLGEGERGSPTTLPPGAYVEVAVIDTGTGMSREVQARLFEPFFTTKPPGKGTGMGLASFYGAVIAHKGAIAVESAPARGSTFRVHLPLAVPTWPTPPTLEAAPAHPLPPARVLVIDDDALVRHRFERSLQALGHTVTSARGGWDGIDRFSGAPARFEAVVLDVMMPDLSGRDVLASLLQLDPTARVIVTSGFARDGEVQAMLDAGACAFLQKPFTREALIAALGQALKASISATHSSTDR
jgi:PAS domain S-box-containing protein